MAEAATVAARRDVRDDVELLARVEERLLEGEVVARGDDQLVRRAALAQKRRQRGEEAVDRRRLRGRLEQRVQLVPERPRPCIIATYCDTRVSSAASPGYAKRRASASASSPTSEPSTGTSRPASIAFRTSAKWSSAGAPTPAGAIETSWRRIAPFSCWSAGPGSIPSSSTSARRAALVDLERLGLPSRAVERQHQLPAQPLAQRMLRDERLELARERRRGGRARARRRSAPRPSRAGALRAAPPPSQRTARSGNRRAARRARARARGAAARRAARAGCAESLLPQALEALEVDRPGIGAQDVAGRPRDERLGPERLPEPRDEVLERGAGRARRRLAPERVDERVRRDDAAGVEEQESEQGPLLLAAECDRPVVRPRPPSGPRSRNSVTSRLCSTDSGRIKAVSEWLADR